MENDTDISQPASGVKTSGGQDQSQKRLSELERFAEIGRLSASLLHEINNPLTAASLWLEQCGNQPSPHIHHARRSINLLRRYVEAARQQVRHHSQDRLFDVGTELEQVKHVLDPIARRKGVSLSFKLTDDCGLYGDPVKFQQIVANLIQNAIDAYDNCPAGGGKSVCLTTKACDGHLLMEVTDHGCGIEEGQLERLFEPFYSTKSGTGLGMGIGLFAVKRSIEADFGGTIRVESSKRRGTRFIARLYPAPKAR